MGKRIKRMLLAVLVLTLACFAGCGVWMNAEYTQLLHQTSALSSETAQRARDGEMSSPEMTSALSEQAEVWVRFVDAREGND